MRLVRRAFMGLALAALLPLSAQAQDYPSRDISLICTFPAGSGADVLVRYFAEKLRPLVGNVNVIVENKPGAAGSIGTTFAARAAPDGYTIMMDAGTSIASIPARFNEPPIDVRSELRIAATINRQAFMIVVPADSEFEDLDALTAHLQEAGDSASYGAAANSGAILGELYRAAAGLDTVQVRYGTAADSLSDLLSGNIVFGAVDPVFSLAQQREGRLRVLAVASGERLAAIPDIPTLVEHGLDVDVTNWWAVAVPGDTPDEIVATINGWYNQILSDPETVAFLNQFGGDPYSTTPEEAQALLTGSIDEWAEFIRIADIPKM